MKHVNSKSERDRHVIEAVVYRFGPISRVDIHELTNLEPGQISRLVRELLDDGRLLQAGHADNPMGRKQILLRLNAKHRFVLGVGFDDESVTAAVMDLHPKIRASVQEPTRLNEGVAGLKGQLLSCARVALQKAGVDANSLIGIGVAGSGVVDRGTGTLIMSSTMEVLKETPLGKIFEKEFGVPTAVENLTRAKAVAERALGAGEMAEDVIYIEYGRTGIGAGIVSNSRLLYGSGFAAGEFGHTHMVEGSPACKCGSFGCLEAIAGAAAIEARIRRAVEEGSISMALDLADGKVDKITGWMVLASAGRGDKACAAIVAEMCKYLGLGLANLVNLFNPSVLVLDERLSLAGPGLLDEMIRVIRLQALSYSAKNLQVKFGKLGTYASVLGMGAFILEKHFEIPALKPPRFLIESLPQLSRKQASRKSSASNLLTDRASATPVLRNAGRMADN